jgi:hypothetical protein
MLNKVCRRNRSYYNSYPLPGIRLYGMEWGLLKLREVKELQGDNGGRQDLQGKLSSHAAETEATASDELTDRL